MFDQMAVGVRIATAKDKMRRVVDHMLYLLELHENNAIIVYSSTLSSQIPRSHAANAFNVFQGALHRFEIVRLCALWDGVDPAKENIPTVVALVENDDVINALVEETRLQWVSGEPRSLNPSDDPELRAAEEKAIRDHQERTASKWACKAHHGLRNAIREAKNIMSSPRLNSVMNLRHRHLAHSLSETRRERTVGPIAPMKYGDERELLVGTLPIVQALYCWVNGTSFSFEDSREINRKNAEALWKGCTFQVLR